MITLGSNIELVGFRDVDPGSMVILKKIIGNYVKKVSELNPKFEKLVLTMKPVHQQDDNKKHEIKGRMMIGSNTIASEITEKNLFFAIDKVLSKMESQLK